MQVCIFFFIALSPIQDVFLQGTPLRGVGASLSLVPLLVMIALIFARWALRGTFTIHRVVLICVAYACAVTAYGFLYFGTTVYGENLFLKTLTNLVSFALPLLAVFIPRYELRSTVRAACYTAFAVLVFGVCFSHPTPFGLPRLLENPLFHYKTLLPSEVAERPRGLSTEPSYLSITVIAICLLCAYLSRRRLSKSFFALAALALLIASGSKGGILVLFICLFIVALTKWHKWYQAPLLAVILIPLGFFAMSLIPTMFPEEGFETSNSVQTRASMILCALNTVAHHPLGVGFSGFLPAVVAYLPNAMDTLQAYSPLPLAFPEVSQYLISSEDVGTKTFFFDQLMRFGIPFAVFFFVVMMKLLKRLAMQEQSILFVAVLASTVALSTYVPLSSQYATSILFGVALLEARKCRMSSIVGNEVRMPKLTPNILAPERLSRTCGYWLLEVPASLGGT